MSLGVMMLARSLSRGAPSRFVVNHSRRSRAPVQVSRLAAVLVFAPLLGASLVLSEPTSAGAATAPPAPLKVSVGPNGDALTGDSWGGRASDDGRWLVFNSAASAFGGTTALPALVIADVQARTAQVIGVSTPDRYIQAPTISPDGKMIAYTEYSGGLHHLRLLDRGTLDSLLIPHPSGSFPLLVNQWGDIFFSSDGRYILFTNYDYRDDREQSMQTAVYDRELLTYEIVSLNESGDLAGWHTYPRGISEDGRYVFFESTALNLPDGALPGGSTTWRMFRRDLQSNVTIEVPTPVGHGNFGLSRNGRYAAAADPGGLIVLDYETGARTPIPLPSNPVASCTTDYRGTFVSNDAQRFYFLGCQDNPYTVGFVWRFDVTSNALTKIAGPDVAFTPFGDLDGVVLNAPTAAIEPRDSDEYADVFIHGQAALPTYKCGSAGVLGVRGSGDNDGPIDKPGEHAVVVASILRDKWGMELYDSDGVDDGAIGVAYPAAAVVEGAEYSLSVNTGRDSLIANIEALRTLCGAAFDVYLVGYSQGAHVIQMAQDLLDERARLAGDTTAASIQGTILIASPRFSSTDSSARGTFAPNTWGVLGGAKVNDRFSSASRAYCLKNDVVCAPGLSVKVHTQGYLGRDGSSSPLMNDAAGFLAWRAGRGALVTEPPTGGLTVHAAPDGGVQPYLSVGSLYAYGRPTVLFKYDFDDDGRVDKVSSSPMIRREGPLAKTGARSSVFVTFADESELKYTVCLDARGRQRTCR